MRWERKYYLHFICDSTELRNSVPCVKWQAGEDQERVERLFTVLVTVKKLLNLSEVYFPYLKQADNNTLQVQDLMKKKMRKYGNHLKNCVIWTC